MPGQGADYAEKLPWGVGWWKKEKTGSRDKTGHESEESANLSVKKLPGRGGGMQAGGQTTALSSRVVRDMPIDLREKRGSRPTGGKKRSGPLLLGKPSGGRCWNLRGSSLYQIRRLFRDREAIRGEKTGEGAVTHYIRRTVT